MRRGPRKLRQERQDFLTLGRQPRHRLERMGNTKARRRSAPDIAKRKLPAPHGLTHAATHPKGIDIALVDLAAFAVVGG